MPYLAQRVVRVVVGVMASLCLATSLASPASAQTGNSSAFGESVNLTVLPTLGGPLGVTSGPLPVSSGSAPPAYNDSDQVASVNVGLNIPLVGLFTFLSTGVLETNAQSPAIPAPTASATVNNLAAALNTLLTIGATSVRSTAAVGGPCGGPLTASGTTTIENATVGGSLGVGLVIGVNPLPNTVLLDVQVGLLVTQRLRVVLNEQILGGDGTTSRSLTVNAIHIFLTNAAVPGIGVISGDIIVSQSRAELSCAGAAANLSITKVDSPDPVTPGQPLTYLITVTNQGPSAAPNVTVTDTLPLSADVTFGSATPSQGTCGVPNPLVCNLGLLNSGASASITVVLNVGAAATGPLSNTATVASGLPDPDTSNNTATTSTTVGGGPGGSANLSITKVDSPDPVTPGQQLTYLITVTNQGPDAATNVTVTDSLPLSADVTFSSATPSQGTCGAPNPLVCNLGTVNSGANATISVVLNVGATATGPLSNTATVASNVSDPDTSNNTATANTTVGGGPGGGANLSITKVDSPDPVAPGQQLTYLITVANQGPGAATNVVVTDTLPLSAAVTFSSATPSQGTCGAPNPLVCNLGTVNAGANATISVVLNVGATATGTLSNIATVASDVSDPDTSNNTATTSTTVGGGPGGSANLSITKVDSPDPVAPGQQLTYLITVTNQGPSAATNVTVTDTLPLSATVTFASATPSQGTCGVPNPLVCSLGTVNALANATISVVLNVGASATGTLSNTVTVASDVFDPNTSNNTATASTTVGGGPGGSANLSMTKVDSPDPVTPGQSLTYLITVTNQGPSAATNVIVTDSLPLSADVTFGSATPSQGTCGAPNPLLCNLGTINGGGNATISVVLNVGATATGTLSNTATVTSDVSDPDPSNNTATAGTTVGSGPAGGANLSITKVDSPDPVAPGQPLTYLITVTNQGPSTATNVSVTETLPLSADVTFGSATPSQGACGAPNPVVCNLGSLGPGASATITVVVNVGAAATGPLGNTATVSSDVSDPDPSNNTSTTSTTVGGGPGGSANLSITKVGSPDPVVAGQQLTYLITVTNQGPSTATNVAMTDTLPLSANVTFVSATPSQGSCGAPNPVVCNLGSLAAGASATVTIIVNVGAGATGPIGNSAVVTSEVSDPEPSNNTGTTSTVVTAPAAAIPTLSEWAVVVMTLLLAAAGYASVRRRAGTLR